MLCIPKSQGAEPVDMPWSICFSVPLSIQVLEVSGTSDTKVFLEELPIKSAVSLRLESFGHNVLALCRRNI